jgi:hypothetical protein
MMGDGVVELKKIRGWVEDAGAASARSRSSRRLVAAARRETLGVCIERHKRVV